MRPTLETLARDVKLLIKGLNEKRKQRVQEIGWLVVFMIYVASAVFQPYRDMEAGDNQSLKIPVARPRIEPRSSCSASQYLNHSATAAPKGAREHIT